MFIEIENGHVRAFSGKRDRYSSAYSTVASRDDGHFALQLSRPR